MPKISLKAARVNAGFTQPQAAAKLNVAVSTLRNWEAGKTYPKQPQIEAMCQLYDISFDVLFFA